MKLNISTDFAIRVITWLATHQTAVTMPLLAEKLHIPYNHLAKIVQTLSHAGILGTRQGKHGGIYLAKSSDDIYLGSVVRLMEGAPQLSECLGNHDFCELYEECQFRHVFFSIQSKINQMFDEIKVSDFAKQKSMEGVKDA